MECCQCVILRRLADSTLCRYIKPPHIKKNGTPFPRSGNLEDIRQIITAMKKLQVHHYIILLVACVVITVVMVALTLGKDVAISVLCTGIGCIIGLIIGTVIKKKSNADK